MEELATWTVVQPTPRRREWELRDGDRIVGSLRLPAFRRVGYAQVGGARLRIEGRGRLRRTHVLIDEASGEERARVERDRRRRVAELDGRAAEWRRLDSKSSGLVDEQGRPLVVGHVRSGLFTSRGELRVSGALDRRSAMAGAVLVAYLLIRRNEDAAAAASSAVVVTSTLG